MTEKPSGSEINCHQAFDAMSDLIAVMDLEHRLVYINKSMATKLGVEPDEVLGTHCYRHVHGTDSPPPFCPHSELIAGGQEHSAEIYEKGLGGDCLVTVSPIRDANNRMIGCVHVARDISVSKQMETALRDQEERYRTLYGGITDAVFVHEMPADDPRGRFLEVNDIACRRLGYTREELLTMSPMDIDATESGIDMKSIMEKLLSGEAAFFEQVNIAKDGRLIPVEINARMFMLQGRRAVISLVRDITERTLIQDKLKRSEASLRNAQQLAHLGNWDWDIVENTLWWSDEIYRIFGLTPQSFGATYAAFLNSVHPDDREFVKASVNKALNEKKPYSIDHRIVLSDGSVRIVHELADVVFDADGKPLRMSGTVQDITERKQAEDAVRNSEKKLRDITSALGEGLYVMNLDGKITFMNPEAERLLGWTEEELRDKNIHQMIHHLKPDGNPLLHDDCPIHNVMRSGRRFVSHDEIFIRKDGSTLPVVVISTPIAEQGEIIAAVTAFRDITERKLLEQEREKLINELQKAIAEIKTLHGIIPICAVCKKIRDDKGAWTQMEAYISRRTDANFSHGYCPECARKVLDDVKNWRNGIR